KLRLDFLPYSGFCKENMAVQYFKLTIIIPDNTFAKIVCEVEKVAFSGMHLGLETQTVQLDRAGRNGVEALLLQNILLNNGSKEGLQSRTVSIQYDQAVVLKQGMHQLTGSIRKVSPLVVCIFYQGGELTRVVGKPQHATILTYDLFHGGRLHRASRRLRGHIPCDFLAVDPCMI